MGRRHSFLPRVVYLRKNYGISYEFINPPLYLFGVFLQWATMWPRALCARFVFWPPTWRRGGIRHPARPNIGPQVALSFSSIMPFSNTPTPPTPSYFPRRPRGGVGRPPRFDAQSFRTPRVCALASFLRDSSLFFLQFPRYSSSLRQPDFCIYAR